MANEYGITPAQQEFNLAMAKALLGHTNYVPDRGMATLPGTWMYGVPNIINAISGARYRDQAFTGEIQGRNAAAESLSNAYAPYLPNRNAPPAPVRQRTSAYNPSAEVGSTQTSDDFLRQLIQIESGGNPNARTGSYRGLGQFGRAEEQRYGIDDSNWNNPEIATAVIKKHMAWLYPQLEQKLGRAPTPGELYLSHQQGVAGGPALLSNPDMPAWKAVRPYYKDDATAQSAIYGNIPNGNPLKSRPPDQISAGEFARLWTSRFDRVASADRMNLGGPTEVSALPGSAQLGAPKPGSPLGPSAASPVGQMPNRVAQAPNAPMPVSDAPRAPGQQPPLPEVLTNPMGNISREQLQSILANPWIPNESKQSLLNMLQQRGTPQSMDVEGGKMMFNQMTGERVFIPEPRFSKIQLGDGMSVDAVSTFDPYTKHWTTKPMLPGTTNAQPNAPGQRSEAPSGMEGLNPLRDWARTQKVETEVASQLAKGQAAPVAEAIQTGIAAPKIIKTLNLLEAASKQGGKDISRGPWAEFIMKSDQVLGWNAKGLPLAELISKINASLAAQSTQAITSRGTNFDMQNFMANNPGLFQSQAGMETLVDILRQERQAEVNLGKLAQKIKPNEVGSWADKVEEYYKKNPIAINVPDQKDKSGRTIERGYKLDTRPIASADEVEQLIKRGVLKPGTRFIGHDGVIREVGKAQ